MIDFILGACEGDQTVTDINLYLLTKKWDWAFIFLTDVQNATKWWPAQKSCNITFRIICQRKNDHWPAQTAPEDLVTAVPLLPIQYPTNPKVKELLMFAMNAAKREFSRSLRRFPLHLWLSSYNRFSSPGRLSTHINVAHTKQGISFVCHVCAKQFACKGNLTYHLTTHQPRVHQVQCQQCGKWLKNKLCLRKHMVQHSMVRFNCDLCEYSALNRQCLRNHVRVQHTDLKPFCCSICGRTFKLKNTLLNHMVQHTGLKKFSCQFCSRTFASSGNYYSHRKRMHPTELADFNRKREEEEK